MRYMACHQDFGGLVENLFASQCEFRASGEMRLAAHLLEVDIAPEDFERQVMESGLKDDERMPGALDKTMSHI